MVLNHEDALQVTALLCWRLGVRKPRIAWATRNTRGCYFPCETVAIVNHGPVFIETLTEVVLAWYRDESLYSWESEYHSIRRAKGRS